MIICLSRLYRYRIFPLLLLVYILALLVLDRDWGPLFMLEAKYLQQLDAKASHDPANQNNHTDDEESRNGSEAADFEASVRRSSSQDYVEVGDSEITTEVCDVSSTLPRNQLTAWLPIRGTHQLFSTFCCTRL